MSTVTDNQKSQADMSTELAHRAGDGLDVLLLWDRSDGRLKVVVEDLRNGASFELVLGDGREALDAYYHPFAYAAAHGLADRTQDVQRAASSEDEPAAPSSVG